MGTSLVRSSHDDFGDGKVGLMVVDETCVA